MSTVVNNLVATYQNNFIPQAVGRSFLYTAGAVAVLSGGAIVPSLTAAATVAYFTFTASIIKPVVYGLLDKSINQKENAALNGVVTAGVLGIAFLVSKVAFGVLFDPFILTVSAAIIFTYSVVALRDEQAWINEPVTVMHPLGLAASCLVNHLL